jgi:hypothetical protein
MADDDPLHAELLRLRCRYRPGRRGADAVRQSDDAARDVPRLVQAAERVLALAEEAKAAPWSVGTMSVWWTLDPAAVRTALVNGLTAKDAGVPGAEG